MRGTLRKGCRHFVRRTLRTSLSWLPFPYCFGPSFSSIYRGLMRTQWYSEEQLQDLQRQKLRSLIRHAYENVPYYRRVFEERRLRPCDFREIGDLQKLPILTKNDVRRNVKDLKAANVMELFVERTSGSSGVPLKLHLDATAINVQKAFVWRHWSWAGYRLHDKCAIIKGQRDFPEGSMWYLDASGKHLVMSSLQLGPKNVGLFVEKLRDFSPRVIRAFPGTAYILAEQMRKEAITDIRPKCVITSSETLFAHQREVIESQFRCRVFDYYGMAERAAIVTQCAQGGYHVNSEYGVIEIITDGRPARPGEKGHIVATGFTNYGMPLIRYDTGDLASPSEATCPCGRGLPLIGSIEGRVRDIIVTPGGRYIYSSFIPFLFYIDPENPRGSEMRGIARYQVVQDTREGLVVSIVRERGYADEDFQYIIRNFKRYIPDMKVELRLVDDVAMTAVGKRRLVISNLSSQILPKGRYDSQAPHLSPMPDSGYDRQIGQAGWNV